MIRRSISILLPAAVIATLLVVAPEPAAGSRNLEAIPADLALSIEGLVWDSSGKALEGARVELSPAPDNFRRLQRLVTGSPEPDSVLRTVTDRSGRYDLVTPGPGLWQVRVLADGFVPAESEAIAVVEAVALAPVALQPDRGVEIRVGTGAAEPAVGAWIHARASDPDAWKARMGEGWFPALRLGRADVEGRVRLPRAAEEGLEVTVFSPEGGRVSASEVRATAALVLPPAPGHRSVRVVDEAGAAVSGVYIVAGSPPWPVGITDEDGHATMTGDLDAALEVQLFATGGQRWRAKLPARKPPARVSGTQEPDPIVFPLDRQLVGRVVAASDGQPLRRALVWPRHDPGTFVLTDAQGGYELSMPPYPRFSVAALASGYVRRSVRAQGGMHSNERAHALALEPSFEVSGQVVDAAGQPVSEVALAVFDAGGAASASRALSDARGAFRLTGLGAVPAKAVARKDGFSPVTAGIPKDALASRRLDSGPFKSLRLVLHRSRGGFGRVLDGEERPISGAEVRVSAFGVSAAEHTEPVTASTDEEGWFEVAALPGTRIDLEARAPGYSALRIRGVEVPPAPDPAEEKTSSSAPELEPDPADLGTLILIPGARIAGRVTDPEGRSIAEAEIRIRDTAEAGVTAPGRAFHEVEVSAVSDTRGRFRLQDLESGRKLWVETRHPHHLPTLLRDVTPPLDEPITIVLEPAASVRGRVLTTREDPIAGAQVTLIAAPSRVGEVVPRGRAGSRSTVADEEGRFVITGVVPGNLEIMADAEGFQPSSPVRLVAEPRESVGGIRLTLARGAGVEGRVFDEEGEPVAGAAVRLRSRRGVSDVHGRFHLTGTTLGPGTLRVEHSEFKRYQQEVLVEAAGNVLEIVLERGLVASGRVVDERGEPVPGAQLALERRDWRDPRRHETVSGVDGRFQVSGVVDGAYDLEAGASGYSSKHLEAALRIAGESVTDLEVVLERGGSVVGEVLGLDFEELLSVEVTAESGPRVEAGTVDHEGTYRVANLAPGNWLVKASLAGGQRQASRHVVIREAAQELRRDLEFDGVTLSGIVTYDGQPLPDTRVTASGRAISTRRSTVTDYQGAFELQDLEPATYRLSVSNQRELLNHTREVSVLSSRDVRIDLESAAVRGRVVTKRDSRPIDGALVIMTQLLGGGGEIGSMVSLVADAEGAFSVSRLTPGRYRLEARKDSYAPSEQFLDIQAGVDPDDLEIALEATEGIELQVRLASGRLPESVLINILDGGGLQIFSELRVGVEGGYVHFPTVPPGAWQVVVSTPGGASHRLAATVPGPPLEVVLQDAGRLRVRVAALSESNLLAKLTLADLGGGSFETVDGAGQLQREWTVVGGAAVVDNIPAGSWILRVVAADGQTWEGAVVTSGAPWSEAEL